MPTRLAKSVEGNEADAQHDCAPIELLVVQALDLVAQYAGSIVDQSEICLALAVIKTGLERLPGASLIRISG